jgi:hypothetical protein
MITIIYIKSCYSVVNFDNCTFQVEGAGEEEVPKPTDKQKESYPLLLRPQDKWASSEPNPSLQGYC